MKKLLLFSLFIYSSLVLAQTEDQQAALGQAIEGYSIVYGAFVLENKCDFLAEELKVRFKNNLETIQATIPEDPSIMKMHRMAEEGARRAAEKPPYSECGKQTEDLVLKSMLLAEEWSNWIRENQGSES